ncbi:MAG: hypothetical protein IJB85_04770 [Clostridia bacterium]|nr:hypothetical protein [Clostridia bacterium]
MCTQNEKSLETKLRRMLEAQGYLLRKSRTSDGYMIVEADFNRIEAGEGFTLDLDDVERFVNE